MQQHIDRRSIASLLVPPDPEALEPSDAVLELLP
jgi:hypothetical protein